MIWLWFISPIDNLSRKEGEKKNKKKIEVIKTVEKARKIYENKFKSNGYNLCCYKLVIDSWSKIWGDNLNINGDKKYPLWLPE